MKRKIIKKMKSLGTYDKSFEVIIDNTVEILNDLKNAREAFENSGSQYIVEHTNKNGNTNIVKNPFYLIIEKLRDDAITHLRELGLTPQGLKKLNIEKQGQQKDILDELFKAR